MAMDAAEDIGAPDLASSIYCDRVASAVGRLSVKVFGLNDVDASHCPPSRPRAAADQHPARLDEDAGLAASTAQEMLAQAGITSTTPDRAGPVAAKACVGRARAPHYARPRDHAARPRKVVRRHAS